MIQHLRANVIKGVGRGTQLDFPTINLTAYSALDVKPGVHVCRANLNSTWYWGVLFFGPRPVFNEDDLSLEIHLFDFPKDTEVPKEIQVEVHKYIRMVEDFDTPEELIKRMEEDVKGAKKYIAEAQKPLLRK